MLICDAPNIFSFRSIIMNEISPYIKTSQIIKIVRELQNPKSFARAQMNPIQFFAVHGIHLPANTQYEIHLSDDTIMYFVLPFDSAKELGEDQLNWIVAAQENPKTSTMSSAGSALCLSSIYSYGSHGTLLTTGGSASTLSTALTFSSVGSASSKEV